MLKKLLLLLAVLLLVAGTAAAEDNRTVLFVAPGAGDEISAYAGGIMAAAEAGDRVLVLYLTDPADPALSAAALSALGVTEEQLLLASQAGTVQEVLAAHRPAVIYAPSAHDTNADYAAYRAIARAVSVLHRADGYQTEVRYTVLHGKVGAQWPLRTRREAGQLIINAYTDPFPGAGAPLAFEEATIFPLTEDMLARKQAALEMYGDRINYLKADEFYWSIPAETLAQAQDITRRCQLFTGTKALKKKEMLDRNYQTSHSIKRGGIIRARSEEEALTGVFLQFFDHAAKVDVQIPAGDDWQTVGSTNGGYLCEYVPLPEGTHEVRLVNQEKRRILIAELTLYGEGTHPPRAPQWRTLEKADMMVLVAHPDDELLWFGGLLPTYAGERGLDVQLVYMVPATPYRRLELLDGLWHCGVDAYPLFGGLRDAKAYDLEGQYKYWNRSQMLAKVIELLRRAKPEVLVTHDANGEYGHGGHRACADICMQAVTMAADASKYQQSAEEFGVWQVKKLYMHLWPENQQRFDWHAPLSAFGGKDGLTVATEALAFHISQTKNGWEMTEGGEMDNALLGLQFTTVGADVLGGDLMENVGE